MVQVAEELHPPQGWRESARSVLIRRIDSLEESIGNTRTQVTGLKQLLALITSRPDEEDPVTPELDEVLWKLLIK